MKVQSKIVHSMVLLVLKKLVKNMNKLKRKLLKTLNKDYINKSSFRQNEKGVPLILHEDK